MGEVEASMSNEAVRLYKDGYKAVHAVEFAKDISYQDTLKMAVLSHSEFLGIDYKNLNQFQWRTKFMEEVKEVLECRSEANELEELWDVIQMCIQRMNMICGNDKDKLKKSNQLHNKKLSERGWVESFKIDSLIYGVIK